MHTFCRNYTLSEQVLLEQEPQQKFKNKASLRSLLNQKLKMLNQTFESKENIILKILFSQNEQNETSFRIKLVWF